eukprot:CAMPEP_0178939016 /NCGR_PEP_ID=MMETSP0786-20121207/26651_1 /TAXON_ID=186022 /ORGANISM="Thalassionema frauenfeldii, Strain CCMP 1798" /LENGTH=189 /DNA_ID=CAMNT_0020617797 /DNA_START=1755 /DNA_END=2321 /DNA_ORIENTATION=-
MMVFTIGGKNQIWNYQSACNQNQCPNHKTYATSKKNSSEAKLYSMTDSGKVALYIKIIVEELGILQTQPTPVSADNEGAIKTAMAQKPTRRTRHIDLKEMLILQWVEEEQLTFTNVKSCYNTSDSLGKPNPPTLFYEHNDIIMGCRKPQYFIHTLTLCKGKYKYIMQNPNTRQPIRHQEGSIMEQLSSI